MSAIRPYAESQFVKIDNRNRRRQRRRHHSGKLRNRPGGRSASKWAAGKVGVSPGLVMRMMRRWLCREPIAADLERKEAAARRHEADRHNRPECERQQQNAGDEPTVTAIEVKPSHIPVES
jgi:hypothetical protein